MWLYIYIYVCSFSFRHIHILNRLHDWKDQTNMCIFIYTYILTTCQNPSSWSTSGTCVIQSRSLKPPLQAFIIPVKAAWSPPKHQSEISFSVTCPAVTHAHWMMAPSLYSRNFFTANASAARETLTGHWMMGTSCGPSSFSDKVEAKGFAGTPQAARR